MEDKTNSQAPEQKSETAARQSAIDRLKSLSVSAKDRLLGWAKSKKAAFDQSGRGDGKTGFSAEMGTFPIPTGEQPASSSSQSNPDKDRGYQGLDIGPRYDHLPVGERYAAQQADLNNRGRSESDSSGVHPPSEVQRGEVNEMTEAMQVAELSRQSPIEQSLSAVSAEVTAKASTAAEQAADSAVDRVPATDSSDYDRYKSELEARREKALGSSEITDNKVDDTPEDKKTEDAADTSASGNSNGFVFRPETSNNSNGQGAENLNDLPQHIPDPIENEGPAREPVLAGVGAAEEGAENKFGGGGSLPSLDAESPVDNGNVNGEDKNPISAADSTTGLEVANTRPQWEPKPLTSNGELVTDAAADTGTTSEASTGNNWVDQRNQEADLWNAGDETSHMSPEQKAAFDAEKQRREAARVKEEEEKAAAEKEDQAKKDREASGRGWQEAHDEVSRVRSWDTPATSEPTVSEESTEPTEPRIPGVEHSVDVTAFGQIPPEEQSSAMDREGIRVEETHAAREEEYRREERERQEEELNKLRRAEVDAERRRQDAEARARFFGRITSRLKIPRVSAEQARNLAVDGLRRYGVGVLSSVAVATAAEGLAHVTGVPFHGLEQAVAIGGVAASLNNLVDQVRRNIPQVKDVLDDRSRDSFRTWYRGMATEYFGAEARKNGVTDEVEMNRIVTEKMRQFNEGTTPEQREQMVKEAMANVYLEKSVGADRADIERTIAEIPPELVARTLDALDISSAEKLAEKVKSHRGKAKEILTEHLKALKGRRLALAAVTGMVTGGVVHELLGAVTGEPGGDGGSGGKTGPDDGPGGGGVDTNPPVGPEAPPIAPPEIGNPLLKDLPSVNVDFPTPGPEGEHFASFEGWMQAKAAEAIKEYLAQNPDKAGSFDSRLLELVKEAPDQFNMADPRDVELAELITRDSRLKDMFDTAGQLHGDLLRYVTEHNPNVADKIHNSIGDDFVSPRSHEWTYFDTETGDKFALPDVKTLIARILNR